MKKRGAREACSTLDPSLLRCRPKMNKTPKQKSMYFVYVLFTDRVSCED